MVKHDKRDKHDKHDKRDKAEKHLAKLTETEEEKRERRLQKKALKAQKRAEGSELAGYSNSANPWNDPNLTEQFVWGKKLEKDGGSREMFSKAAQKRRREELATELEKVKHSRDQREREKEEMEEERRLLEREREQLAFADNEKREDDFQHEQSKRRALIRQQEGRARPIDHLCASLTLFEAEIPPERALEVELQEPIGVFHQLNIRELRELRAEIASYSDLDDGNVDLWKSMAHLCEHKLQEALEAMRPARERAAKGVHSEVEAEVVAMLAGKSVAQLDEMHAQITQRVQQGDEDVDMDYWDSVLTQLGLTRAHATLNDTYTRLRRRRAQLLGGAKSSAAAESLTAAEGGSSQDAVRSHSPLLVQEGEEEEAGGRRTSKGAGPSSGRLSPELLPDEEVDYEDGSGEEEDAEVAATTASGGASGSGGAVGGRYSPALLSAQEVELAEAVDEEEDARQILAMRGVVKSRAMDTSQPASNKANDGADAQVAAEARKGMESGEARFSFEVPLEHKVAWWHDKYKPRKPKYFNRIHTGYEWNKYNQTHFDHDNPPPKMVQGYKFNVFYPDLIDRTKTPTYSLHPDPSGAKDTCILRIKGGPPYEDLAFKIVNREWETSHKRGFRVRFERGILQLFFNFKRHRYRR
uniref:Splicing factor Cactin n=1 Tax=Coccolithus braarudii TaxID=221442 RepID=A0A6T7CIP1_9EUKA|mmetsp:Transcript_10837/g.23616  ORF Transcript_10837/g.23616 Transcript_10837/m.23616 type:complete len:641 (+) Transcript_10837:52-1974(+)